MSDISEKFWDASVEELKKGYVFDEETEEYICLACGETFIKGLFIKIIKFCMKQRSLYNCMCKTNIRLCLIIY